MEAQNLVQYSQTITIDKNEAVFRFDASMTSIQIEGFKALLALARKQLDQYKNEQRARVVVEMGTFKQIMQIVDPDDDVALEKLRELQRLTVEVDVYDEKGKRLEERLMTLISECYVENMDSDKMIVTIFFPRTFKEVLESSI